MTQYQPRFWPLLEFLRNWKAPHNNRTKNFLTAVNFFLIYDHFLFSTTTTENNVKTPLNHLKNNFPYRHLHTSGIRIRPLHPHRPSQPRIQWLIIPKPTKNFQILLFLLPESTVRDHLSHYFHFVAPLFVSALPRRKISQLDASNFFQCK